MNENKVLQEHVKENEQEIENLNEKVNEKQETYEKIVENLDSSEEKVNVLKLEKHKLQKRLCGLRINSNKRKSFLVEKHEDEIQELKNEISEHNIRISELEQLNILLESDQIVTFENGKYSNEIRECIMSLVTECNVSLNKVNSVISTVLHKLSGVLPDRLPSMAVKSRLLIEAKAVAQQQIVDAMLQDVDPAALVGNTLHSDATSKYFKHYQSYQVTLSNGNSMSIGLTEVGCADSDTMLQSFKSLVQDLADSCSQHEVQRDVKVAKLVTSITNTMSDQGSINPIFNSALSEMRGNLLPSVLDNWHNLDEATQEHLRSMGHFFCKMHLLVNFATECDKCLKIFEQNVIVSGRNPNAFNNSESGASRLVRTAAKALTTHGSEKAGVASYWQSFLDDVGQKNHLVTFRANRFNILFYDSAALYFHRDHLTNFLNQWISPNDLLKSVEFDINEKIYLAEIRALGIIDKIITGPLWRLFEKKGSILSLNPQFLKVTNYFLTFLCTKLMFMNHYLTTVILNLTH